MFLMNPVYTIMSSCLYNRILILLKEIKLSKVLQYITFTVSHRFHLILNLNPLVGQCTFIDVLLKIRLVFCDCECDGILAYK